MDNNYPDVCAIAHFHSIQESNKQYVTEFSYIDCLGRILLYRVVLPKPVRSRIFDRRSATFYNSPSLLNSGNIQDVKDIHVKDLQDKLYYDMRPRLLLLNQNFKIGICMGRVDHRRFFDYVSCPTVEIVHDCEKYDPWFINCNNHLRYPTLNCSLAYTLRMLRETSWWEKAVGELEAAGYIQKHRPADFDLDTDFPMLNLE